MINEILKILKYKYSHGESLYNIHKELKSAYGHIDGVNIFSEFYKKNKRNKFFVEEFNKTSFHLN